jgi:hypothetical protein
VAGQYLESVFVTHSSILSLPAYGQIGGIDGSGLKELLDPFCIFTAINPTGSGTQRNVTLFLLDRAHKLSVNIPRQV